MLSFVISQGNLHLFCVDFTQQRINPYPLFETMLAYLILYQFPKHRLLVSVRCTLSLTWFGYLCVYPQQPVNSEEFHWVKWSKELRKGLHNLVPCTLCYSGAPDALRPLGWCFSMWPWSHWVAVSCKSVEALRIRLRTCCSLVTNLEPELPTSLLSLPGFCIAVGNLPWWDHCREVCYRESWHPLFPGSQSAFIQLRIDTWVDWQINLLVKQHQ